jgi:hypothetical protein
MGPSSVICIATGYGLDGPGIESRWEARFSAPVHTGPGAHPASRTMNTGSFPGVKSGRGVTLTLHPLLVPWSWKSRAIPLLPIWAVRPVQSLSACTRVHFTLFTLYGKHTLNICALLNLSHLCFLNLSQHIRIFLYIAVNRCSVNVWNTEPLTTIMIKKITMHILRMKQRQVQHLTKSPFPPLSTPKRGQPQ